MKGQDPLVGQTIHGGAIRLERLLGVGGMGRVYKGIDLRLSRSVAVKVLQPESLETKEAAVYFEREARAASQLWHPNLIQIIDFGEEDGVLYLIMEFIPGINLADLIDDEFPIPSQRLIRIVSQILTGLEAAHGSGIIHRDLKPENIMLQDLPGAKDFVKVLDFGIAKALNSDQKAGPLTMQGLLVGTPQFMSPEQALGHELDARSDLYSVGAIMYQMLTQYMPFDGELVMHVLAKVITERPVEPSKRRPNLAIPPQLESICLRALRKRPEGRFQSAAEFRQALVDVDLSERSHSFGRSGTDVSAQPLAASEGEADPLGSIRSHTHTIARDAMLDAHHEPRIGAQDEGEFVVTVLAVDIRSPLLEPINTVLSEITRSHSGAVIQSGGEVFIAVFGHPQTLDHSAVFALNAAQDALAECLQNSQVKFGVALAYGSINVDGSLIESAFGVPIENAVELAQAADDNSILAHTSLERAGAPIALRPTSRRDAFFPKHAEGTARSVAVGIPLMGREQALQSLDQMLSPLFEGSAVSLAVVGARGIGKTRILNILARHAERENIACIEITAERYTSILPGLLVQRLLIAALELVPANSPREALETFAMRPVERHALACLLELEPPPGGRDIWGQLLLSGFAKLLTSLATNQTLLITCDNFEACDELSFRIIERLSFSVGDVPVAIIIASIADYPNTARFCRHHDALTLSPIPEQTIRAFLGSSYPGIGPEAIESLSQLASRKPHLLTWLQQAHMSTTGSTQTMTGEDISALLNPMRTLSPETQRIATAAACLGYTFPITLLKGTCPKGWNLRAHLHDIGSTGMLILRETHDSVWLGFYPSVVRIDALQRSAVELRREVHQRAAKFLERHRKRGGHPDHDFQWGRHLLSAGFPEAAFKMFKLSLDATVDRFGPIAAFPLLDALTEAAHQAYDPSHPRFQLAAFKVARCYLTLGLADKSLLHLNAVELDEDTPRHLFVELEVLRARTLSALGRHEEAIRVLSAAKARVDGLNAVYRAEVCFEDGLLRFHNHHYPEALEQGLIACDLLETVDDLPFLSRSLLWHPVQLVAHCFARGRRVNDAIDRLQRGLADAKRRKDVEAQIELTHTLAQIYERNSNLEAAAGCYDQATELARNLGDFARLSRILYDRGRLHLRRSEGDRAYGDFVESLAITRRLADMSLHQELQQQLAGFEANGR